MYIKYVVMSMNFELNLIETYNYYGLSHETLQHYTYVM